MENKFIENWQEYGKHAIAAAKELEAINTEVIEKLTGKQMELANTVFETGTKYFGAISEVKGYQELISAQTKLVAELNEKLIEAARGTADIIAQTREAYQAWIEKGFKAATANTDLVVPNFSFAKKAEKKVA